MNRGDRVEVPLLQDGEHHAAVDWDHALQRVSEILAGTSGRAALIVSPNVSNEALFFAKRSLAKFETRAVFRVHRVDGEAPLAGVPNLALRGERAANASGARALGFAEGDPNDALDGASVALVLGDDLEGVEEARLDGVGYVIYVGSTLPTAARGAAVILPAANTVEEDGSFINRDGRVQRYQQAKSAPGMARPAWWILAELLREMGEGDGADTAAHAFDMIGTVEKDFEGLSYEAMGFRGQMLATAGAVSG